VSGVLVRGGTVVDGTGAPGYASDVRVRHGVIVEIGRGLRPDGEVGLDADGAVVTPGFIDNHTHFDPSLFWDPFCDPMPQHGVTSVLIGNCSLSLAPMRADLRDGMSEVFSYIEDIPLPAFRDDVPWGWESYAEYRDATARGGLGVNVACLVGHTPLRLCAMGADAWERAATPAEVAAMSALLREALAAGAFGLSTSFFDEDAASRPVPPRLADQAELEALFDVLADAGGVVEFIPNLYSPTSRDDIERIAALTGARGLVSTWNTVIHDDARPQRGQRILDRAAELQAAGVSIHPQVSPRTLDAQVNWQSSMAFMPLATSWHRFVHSDAAAKRAMLTDDGWRAAARTEWDATQGSIFPVRRPEKVRFVSVGRPELSPWVGRTLADLAAERPGHLSDVLADWMLENDFATGVVVVIGNDDPDGVANLLTHPAALVGASDAGAHLQMFCASGDSTLLLTRHVRDRGDMSLEHAVHQLTGRQAELLGFDGRGVLAPGAVADLAVFALDELSWDPEVFVDDLPAGGGRFRRPAGGYRYTVASGVVTQSGGELTGARPATVLRRG
jgi:N-acyl-D-aspartate/D-glutamate deacylase